MWIVLYCLIAISSVLVLPVTESYWMPKNTAFIILGIIFIASCWLSNKRSRTTFNSLWISLILIYFALHFGWFFLKPLTFPNARGEIEWRMWTMIPSINIFLGLMLIYYLVEYTDTYDRWINTAKVLCWLGFGLSIYAILQYFDLDQVFRHTTRIHSNDACMFFGNPMLAGHFLAMISPLCLMFRKTRYILIYCIMGIAVYFIKSHSAIVIFVFGLILFLFLTGKIKWALVIILFSLAGGIHLYNYDPTFFNFQGRLVLWQKTIEFCKEAPYTGFGSGFFVTRQFIPDPNVASWAHVPHNTLLLIWHDWGLGVILVICYLFDLCRRLFYVDNSMMLICYIVAFVNYLLVCQVGFPLSIAPMILIGILYISCLEIHCSTSR